MNDIELMKRIAQGLNTAMVLALAFGLWMRRRPAVHVPVMLLSFVVDLGNLLFVEFVIARGGSQEGKGAVERMTEEIARGTASTIALVHISVSILFILGYLVAIYTGTKLYKHGRNRRAHQVNAAVFIAMRLTSYVTSFWM